jgi:hypothetical protein
MPTWAKVCWCFALAFMFSQNISSLLGSPIRGFLAVMTWAVLMSLLFVWIDRRHARSAKEQMPEVKLPNPAPTGTQQ